MLCKRPLVGIGVIIENKNGNILIAKRIGTHAPKYSIVGGSLELGETFEEAAIREVKEETDLDIRSPKVLCITNNLETFNEEGRHSVSIILLAKTFSGTPKVMEPEKLTEWFWCDPRKLTEPHYEASRLGVACYLEKKFYMRK